MSRSAGIQAWIQCIAALLAVVVALLPYILPEYMAPAPPPPNETSVWVRAKFTDHGNFYLKDDSGRLYLVSFEDYRTARLTGITILREL